MQIFVNPDYDFVKWRNRATIISLLIIAGGLGIFLTQGMRLGIDFAGGANIVLKFRDSVPTDQLRADLPSATIQQYGRASENDVLIRLPQQGREGDYAGQVVNDLWKKLNPEAATKHDLNYLGTDRLAELLQSTDPEARGTNVAAQEYYRGIAEKIIDRRSELGIFTSIGQVTSVPGVTARITNVLADKAFLGRFNLLNQETVGPQVGKELQRKAIWAIVLSALAMGIYIAIRFESGLIFGAAALICIVHDVLIAITALLLIKMEFSLNVVAALLTVVGYSVNDTVVTYDRVRENRRKSKGRQSLGYHLNLAMNQTLSRTILTAGSVALVLIALLAFGGEVIRDFSFILLVGVISGTYSTLYIVPAVAVAWERWNDRKAASTSPLRVEQPRTEPAAAKKRKAS